MSNPLQQTIEALAKEKGIEPDVVISAIEEVTNDATEISLGQAREMYRPIYGDDVANSIELGDEMEFPKPTEVLGRIAAQTAKQVIFQKVREAERENIFAEFNQ